MLTLFMTSQTLTAKCKTAAFTATFFAICFCRRFSVGLWLVLFQIYGVVLFQIYGVVLFQIYGVVLLKSYGVILFQIYGVVLFQTYGVDLFEIYGGCSFVPHLWWFCLKFMV